MSTRLSSEPIPRIHHTESRKQINADQQQSDAWRLHSARSGAVLNIRACFKSPPSWLNPRARAGIQKKFRIFQMEYRHILAESEHYRVNHELETVYLLRKTGLPAISKDGVIGDFYGDPTAAIIDEKERFVIMAGRGLIIYNLVQPFEPYRYDVQTSQWVEMFREERNCWWVESLTQKEENTFHFTTDPNSDKAGTYELTLPDLAIQKLR
jgi:hypothetical protein